jgi:hypothetical protein
MWLIVVIVLVIWYFTARGQKREKQERLALRRFNYDRRIGDSVGQDWTADFVEMKLVITGYDYGGVPAGSGFGKPSFYSIRRHEGKWEARMTDASRLEEAERLARAIKKGAGGSVLIASAIEDDKKALAELQEPKWVAIDGELAGPLESQYQRFVVHYRES